MSSTIRPIYLKSLSIAMFSLLVLSTFNIASGKDLDLFVPDGWIYIPAQAFSYPQKILQNLPYGKFYQDAKMGAWVNQLGDSVGPGEMLFCQWDLQKGSDGDNIKAVLNQSFNPKWPVAEQKSLKIGQTEVTRLTLNIKRMEGANRMVVYFFREGKSLDGILGVSSDSDFDKYASIFEDTLAHILNPDDPALKPNSQWQTYVLKDYGFSFESPMPMQLVPMPAGNGFFLHSRGFYHTLGLTVSNGPYQDTLANLAKATVAFLESPQEKYTHFHPTNKAMVCSGCPALLTEGSFVDHKGMPGKMKSYAVKKRDQVWKADIFYAKTDKNGGTAAKRIIGSLKLNQ